MYTVSTPTPDYVVTVIFETIGTDGTYTASIGGSIQLEAKAENSNFIPYADLTEADVIGWINDQTDNQANYYANIDAQINSLINPPVTPVNTPLPWAN
jgi:hypothetical protein